MLGLVSPSVHIKTHVSDVQYLCIITTDGPWMLCGAGVFIWWSAGEKVYPR